jgi:hypothetical protein
MTPRPVGQGSAPHHAAQGLGMAEGEADVPWYLELRRAVWAPLSTLPLVLPLRSATPLETLSPTH